MVLLLGAVAVSGVILVVGFLAAVQSTRREDRVALATQGSIASAVNAASRAGMTPVATTGMRMALESGRGSVKVPVRSAVFGAVFGVLGVVAVFMFASSVDQVVASSERVRLDVELCRSHRPAQRRRAKRTIDARARRRRRRPTAGPERATRRATCDRMGLQVSARPDRPRSGVRTRAAWPDEVALGTATLDELGKSIGDTVHGQGPDGNHNYRVVGRVVFPKLEPRSRSRTGRRSPAPASTGS